MSSYEFEYIFIYIYIYIYIYIKLYIDKNSNILLNMLRIRKMTLLNSMDYGSL